MAPFLVIKLCLTTVFGWFGATGSGGWAYDLLAIFAIALCFYMAERHEVFRQFYVHFAPLLTGLGLLYWMGKQTGFFNPGYFFIAILIWFFSVRVWRFSVSRGYQALSDGGDKKFAKAKAFYAQGDYASALPLLEKSAAKGHFQSLHVLGQAYEDGQFYERDLIKAAQLYLKSSKKGWAPAEERFKIVYDKLSPTEQESFEQNMLDSWLD